MSIKPLTAQFAASEQLSIAEVGSLKTLGYTTLINNRPDGEAAGQPTSASIAAAAAQAGLTYHHLPVKPGAVDDASVRQFAKVLASAPGPVLAFCRSGMRSATLWSLAAPDGERESRIQAARAVGYQLPLNPAPPPSSARHADILIIGGGAAGLAVAASLRQRDSSRSIFLIEPREVHYYQPGWTMVGGGIFDQQSTCRDEAGLMPSGVTWIKSAAQRIEPERGQVVLADGSVVSYRFLITAPGIELDWNAVTGLKETLGSNGVTSNYSFEHAPYTWALTQQLREGEALFTQPPMPIKCAGAPQKAMYLACDFWRQTNVLKNIKVSFHNAGPVLFGVKEFVPALMEYVERYHIDLAFGSRLIAVDGPAHQATFKTSAGEQTRHFDMLHVCPPQRSPRLIAESSLADAAGYAEVDPATMRHTRFANVFALGDAGSTPNAKTAAAARKQAPVVAENVLSALKGEELKAFYDGYGSCPLTVERGKIILAEFGYGGKLLPSFPNWVIDGQKAQRLPWLLKSEALPWIYWNGMLKGHEWMAHPQHRTAGAVA
jgi:sulfide:quinone oxidoreductase